MSAFHDFYLKAADQATIDAALAEAGLLDQDGEPTEGVSIDRIGPITRVTGMEADGETPITSTDPDYHLNLRLRFVPTEAQQAALAAYEIMPPAAPFRVWS